MNDRKRKLFIGIVPMTSDLKIDSDNIMQVKNFVAMSQLSLKDLMFRIYDESFSNDNIGAIELGFNLPELNIDEEELSRNVEIVKDILTLRNVDYDDDTTFPDILKRFYNICAQLDVLDHDDLDKFDDQQWKSLTKLLMTAGQIGEDWVDNRKREYENTTAPILSVNGITAELISELYNNLEKPLLYMGYAIYSAIENTFNNDLTKEELPNISDIELYSIKTADRIISSIPDSHDISEDIEEMLNAEYKKEFEIPEGYKLN